MPMSQRRRNIEPPWKKWERLSCRNGLRHAVFSNSGVKYCGEWRNDSKGGKGYQSNARGWLYEGDWEQGLRHGHGVLSRHKKNGCVKIYYTGEWRFGKKEGNGRQVYDNGGVYQGEWLDGKRCGHGQMWHKNGDFYEGYWENDLPHGYGTFIHENGCMFKGEWQNGFKHGRGHFYHLKTGQLQEGLWVNGVCHCCVFTDIQFRQSSLNPTQFPIQNIRLANSADVSHQAEEQLINNHGILAQRRTAFDGLK